ncbi:hypothetical protein MFUL124B02_07810 [Myxococcus fulvus 124B02]|nr:hypothetical protein MFUL124B02_07810 [Myxococcus fulvus 124B02]
MQSPRGHRPLTHRSFREAGDARTLIRSELGFG